MEIELTPQMLALIPVVAAILQMLKRIEAVQTIKDWLPFVSIAIAIGLAYIANIPAPLLPGILIGLMASGAYDVLKNKNIKA